jgi:hypothetical protein
VGTDGHTGTRLSRRRGHADALRTVDELVLHGGRDSIVPVVNARLMARHIPHAALTGIPGAGQDGLTVYFEGGDAPESAVFDKVLVASR